MKKAKESEYIKFPTIKEIQNKWQFTVTGDYYKDLAMRESSGNSTKVTGTHFGLYQMGYEALADCEYIATKNVPIPNDSKKRTNKVIQKDHKGTPIWTGKHGINSEKDFLDNSEVQELAIREYQIDKIWNKQLRHYQKYEGQEIAGIKLTKVGMISCAHLAGHTALKQFINDKGTTDLGDTNFTTCSQYLIGFLEHEADWSIEPFVKKLQETRKYYDPKQNSEKSRHEQQAKSKASKASEEAEKHQAKAEGKAQVGAEVEKVKLEQELAKAQLECKTASEEWNEWSNGIGKDISHDDPEHISRDQKCQAIFKNVRNLKQKLNGKPIEQTEKVEQADVGKARQEQEAKQKAETDRRASEERAREQEQKSATAKAQKQQEESKKAEQEQANQNQEQETAQQQSQSQSNTNQIDADQSQNAGNADTSNEEGNTEVAKQSEQGSNGQDNNGGLPEFVLTEEEKATVERTLSERSAVEAKAKAEQEGQLIAGALRQQKEVQKLHNSIERDHLERSGVKLSAHDQIADSNPNIEAMKLNHIGHDYTNQQSELAVGNVSSTSENTKVNKSLSYSSIGTDSGIGRVKGIDCGSKASSNSSSDAGYSNVGSSGAEGNSNQIPTISITCENPTTHSDGQTYCGAEVLGDSASYADPGT